MWTPSHGKAGALQPDMIHRGEDNLLQRHNLEEPLYDLTKKGFGRKEENYHIEAALHRQKKVKSTITSFSNTKIYVTSAIFVILIHFLISKLFSIGLPVTVTKSCILYLVLQLKSKNWSPYHNISKVLEF